MNNRDGWRKRVQNAAKQLAAFGGNLEKECARMNDGLAAIAIALAIVTLLTAAVRVPVMLADRGDHVAQLQDED